MRAGGTIGVTRVARANPDGYQLLMGNLGSQAASVGATSHLTCLYLHSLLDVKPTHVAGLVVAVPKRLDSIPGVPIIKKAGMTAQ